MSSKNKKLGFDYIPLNEIDISSLNVRKVNLEEGLEELAESIKEIGVQQPIMVFQKPDKRYELIIGQRRYLASKKAGEDDIPAVITKVKDKTEALIKSFSENIHRLDLEYKDKMWVASELLKKFGSIEKVAKITGVTTLTVKNWLGYASVPEPMKKMVSERKLGAHTALRIVKKIPDQEKAIKIAKMIEEIPRQKDKLETIDVAKENPDKEIKEIREIAIKRRKTPGLTLDLTERIAGALDKASKEYNCDKEDIAIEALEEWLTKRRFIE